VPAWLSVHGLNNGSSRNPTHISTLNATEELPGNRIRYTFAATNSRWSTYNNYVPLYTTFAADHAGNRTQPQPPVVLPVLIHATPTDAKAIPVVSWQQLRVRFAATPNLLTVPKRLVTSFTWADTSLLYDPPGTPPDQPWPFLTLYRGLGFNTVPMVSMPGFFEKWTKYNTTVVPKANAPPYLFPDGRRGKQWEGLRFGPEVSAPDVSGGASTCKKDAPNADMLPSGLSSAEIKVELAKWSNAYNFSKVTGGLDVAYDGIFAQRNRLQFCDLMAKTQPDWVFLDDEAYGEGWVPWASNVGVSENAVARALPGETLMDLAWRMALETFSGFTKCLTSVSPNTTLAWYGTPFPDQVFASAGISMQPSLYSSLRYLQDYVWDVREARQSQGVMAAGKPRHLLPWLTACTYGQMDAVAMWEAALHTFGGGATGFSFFWDTCIDDPGAVLSLKTNLAQKGLEDVHGSSRRVIQTQPVRSICCVLPFRSISCVFTIVTF
jgi:hypothetical protein